MPAPKNLKQFLSRSAVLAGLTLLTGALFKLAAFVRETFIASRFGLSSITDAYFGLQQFPLILATFLFGAFALAFTPAYADAKRKDGTVAWLPGLLLLGCLAGGLLTFALIPLAPKLLRSIGLPQSPAAAQTLFLLAVTFVPIVALGIWSAVTVAAGKNLLALFVSGLPYLLMTLSLLGLYAAGRLNNLSLPISFLFGFGTVGLYALWSLLTKEGHPSGWRDVVSIWKDSGFKEFLRQLAASSIENVGFSANQLLILYFLAHLGTGAVSANNCAMRIGMLGYSLLAQPLTQLAQARLCTAPQENRLPVFRKWLIAITAMVLLFALALFLLRDPVTRLIYLRGKFSEADLTRVLEVLPAWIAYFLVSSLNAVTARFLFTVSRGSIYVRRQLGAYAVGNAVRLILVVWGSPTAGAIVWCSVFAEGVALLINLRSCFVPATEGRPAVTSALAGVRP